MVTPLNLARNAQEQPASPPPKAPSGLEVLLRLEADLRRASTPQELAFIATNELGRLVQARQVFLVRVRGRRCCVLNVSGMSEVNRHSSRIVWIERLARQLVDAAPKSKVMPFTLPEHCPPGDGEYREYPFPHLAWFPLRLRDGTIVAGLLLARDIPWQDGEAVIGERLAETAAHAWSGLVRPAILKRSFSVPAWSWLALVAAAGAAGFVPVPMSVLAPFEVVSTSPRVVAAPVEGVIDKIMIAPNSTVSAGQTLFKMNDTTWRNGYDVANREVQVAEARLKQLTQSSIDDPKSRRDLRVAQAERDLKVAQRDYSKDLLDRSVVTAPIGGVLIFSDRRDWEGKPVAVGQRVMQIADPDDVEMEVTVPVADSIAVVSGAAVRAYFDFDPLSPIEAKVRLASFEARDVEGVGLAYRIYAAMTPDQAFKPRLGLRGTARITGQTVPLAYYLFRKPISALRQWLGR